MSAPACREVRAALSAYLDGELDARLAGEIRAHLEGCAGCRSELDLQRLTVGALQRLPELPPPAAILACVRARLRPEPWYRRLLDGSRWRLGVPIGALASLLVILGISLFQSRYSGIEKMTERSQLPSAPAPAASPASPALDELRAKGVPGAVIPPRVAAREGIVATSESTVQAGADNRDGYRATPAPPAESVVRTDFAAVESKVRQALPSPPQPQAGALKDARQEESERVEIVAAAPARNEVSKPEPAKERTVAVDEFNAGRSAGMLSLSKQDAAARVELGNEVGTISRTAADKKEAAAPLSRMAASGARPGGAKLAEEKAAAGIRVVCLLPADGDTVEDLTRLLRREGALRIEVGTLQPPAIREAFARHRGRPGLPPEPSLGWTVTASVQPHSFAPLLHAITSRPGLRILEQPDTSAAPEDQTESLDLRITVFQ